MSETIECDVADATTMALYEAAPSGQPSGAVIVVQEAFGVNDHIEDVARRFADAGLCAVAPHLFHRSGDPRLSYDSFQETRPHVGALSADGIGEDLDATLDHLHRRGFDDEAIAIVGFCMGGTVALHAGVQRTLGAAVSFYGGGVAEGRFGSVALIEAAPSLRSPWLGLYGDQDQSIPVAQVEALREAASRASVPTEIVRYPEAGHGFHCDAREAYEPGSAADGWARCLAWLGEHLRRSRP